MWIDFKSFRTQLAATLVSAALLAYVPKWLGYFPELYQSVSDFFARALKVLGDPIGMPLWLVLVIVFIFVRLLFVKLRSLHRSRTEKGADLTTPRPADAVVTYRLTDVEERALRYITRLDGKSASATEVAKALNVQRLVAEQALESLNTRGLLGDVLHIGEGQLYFLSSPGRDFALACNFHKPVSERPK